MEKKITILTVFFISVAIVSLAGFFNSYIQFLPEVRKFQLAIHLHFAAFVCWFALLIIQPILIRKRKYNLHRKIGKLSYLIAPIILVTILILVRNQVQRELLMSKENAAFTGLIGLLDAISFSIYFTIAMVNKNNHRWHVAFIIAATLIILNPGMSRLLNQLKPGSGLIFAVFFPFIVSLSIVMYEKIKLRREITKNPYFLFFICWAFEILLFVTLPQTSFWQDMVFKFLNV